MSNRLPRANTWFIHYTNAQLGNVAQDIHDGLLASVADFPSPPIAPLDLATLITDYTTKLAASIGGSKEQRAAMHASRAALRAALREDANYVNQVVWTQISQGTSYTDAKNLILETNYQLGKDPTPVGPLPQAIVKKFSSPAPGQLYVLGIKIPGAKSYQILYGVTGTDESIWTLLTQPNTRMNVYGITSGTSITFMIAGIGASGIRTYSNQHTQIIT